MASSHLRAHQRGALADLPPIVAEYAQETGAFGRVRPASADEATYRRRELVLDLVERGQLVVATPAELRRAIEAVSAAGVVDALPPRDIDAGTSPHSGNAR
jgi:hypothetical protein